MSGAIGPMSGADGGRRGPPCEEVRVHLGGYVLDGLEPGEAGAVSDHLCSCQSCAAEVADLAVLPELLALLEDAPPEPPAAVRTRVLDEARRRRPARRRVVALVAALLAVVVAGAAAVVRPGSVEGPERPAPQTETTTALHPGEGSDASGALTLRPSGSGLLVELEVAGLDPLPPGGVYEAWLREPGREKPISIGRFQRGQGATAAVAFTASGGLDDYDGFWITAEPDATDPAHQGPTVLWADIPSPQPER